MSNVIPSYHSLMVPVFQALQKLGGTSSNSEIGEYVFNQLGLPADAKEKLFYNLTWARSYLKKYEIIHSEKRTIWSLDSTYVDCSSEDIKKIINENKKKFIRN